jgi:hypothetical protein
MKLLRGLKVTVLPFAPMTRRPNPA